MLAKPKKRPKKSGAAKALDTVFAEYIRKRDRCCITCGSSDNLQCSHFIAKAQGYALRWDEENCNAQCAGCHMEFHNRDHIPYTMAMVERYGPEILETLTKRKQVKVSLTIEDLRVLKKAYEKKVSNL